MNRGDIYWVELDPTKGAEINKRRPCVIVSATQINKARNTVIVIPLSTAAIPRPPLNVAVQSLGQPTVGRCDQIRTIDKTRLIKFASKVSDEDLEALENGLRQVLSL